ncbi:hypothetical protein [Mastigocoleus testarum]|uniref:Uncharacterized protein n=1 Tax=Mastigocoleus testarum BC008 TaxID=371196 RepID=A0A0V7ZK14_9CYAN|nr:hypothetical protein [Mastigocoleus testarum]KST62200.1 hypothetical protein BC008_37790 [Mastigocoleus testarum BC008]KST64830.1 hypothetical protein BC008_18620 [Mastigocoleus testarum BC008]
MKRTQPYIPKAGKLALQIQQLRSFGLSNFDFSQRIASKYSGLKLGKFPLVTLILLHKASSESNIFNVNQFLKKEVIHSLHSTTQLELKLNFLFFWNTAVQKTLRRESNNQPQNLQKELLTFSKSSSILITKASQLQNHQQTSMGLKLQQRWLNQNILLLRLQNLKTIPLSFLPERQFRSDSRTKLVIQELPREKVIRIIGTEVSELAQRTVGVDSTATGIDLPQENSNLKPLEISNEQLSSIIDDSLDSNTEFSSDFSKDDSILITRTSQLKSNQPLNMGLKLQQQWLNQNVLLLRLSQNFKTIPLSFPERQVGKNWRSQLIIDDNSLGSNTEFVRDLVVESPYKFLRKPFHTTLQQRLQNKKDKNHESFRVQKLGRKFVSQVVFSLPHFFTFLLPRNLPLVSSKISTLDILTFLSPKQKFKLLPNNPIQLALSNLYPNQSVSSGFDSELVNLIFKQNEKEVVNLSDRNLLDENINKSWFPDFQTRLKKTQTSLLIYSVNMSQTISTFERRFNFIHKQQNNEKKSTLDLRKKDLRKTVIDLHDDFQPHHIRTKRLKQIPTNKLGSTYEGLIFQNTVANKQSEQKDSKFSKTSAMEFAQSKAMTTPVSSNQENQVVRKNAWEQHKKTDFDLSNIDVNGLADRVFQVIERKLKIERQRRGLL